MPPTWTMAEPTRSSINGEGLEAFQAGNPSLADGPLIGMVSHLPVPPLKVNHHRIAVYVVYLHLTRVCEQFSH